MLYIIRFSNFSIAQDLTLMKLSILIYKFIL